MKLLTIACLFGLAAWGATSTLECKLNEPGCYKSPLESTPLPYLPAKEPYTYWYVSYLWEKGHGWTTVERQAADELDIAKVYLGLKEKAPQLTVISWQQLSKRQYDELSKAMKK